MSSACARVEALQPSRMSVLFTFYIVSSFKKWEGVYFIYEEFFLTSMPLVCGGWVGGEGGGSDGLGDDSFLEILFMYYEVSIFFLFPLALDIRQSRRGRPR